MIIRKKKTNEKMKSGLLFGISGLVSITLVMSALVNVFATASDYYFDGATISLDGTSNATAYTYLKSTEGGTFYTMQGDFSLTETNDSDNYITLQDLIASGEAGSTSKDLTTGRLMRRDMDFEGFQSGPNGALMIALYTVDKDTPAGDYTVSLTNCAIVGGSSGFDGERLPNMNATIRVTRTDTPPEKPTQTILFKDADNNPFTTITKQYGDEPFVVNVVPTEGEVAEGSYHPMDSGEGPHVATTDPSSNLVRVENVGDVQICATVNETENYAETTACYTVYVTKRPITITGATVRSKTYDGTVWTTVDGVTFDTNNVEYLATASFADEGVGNNKDVTVTVALTGNSITNYNLSTTTFATTSSITPLELQSGDVILDNGDTYKYSGSAIMPAVTVTATTHGGTTTLVPDRDYTVSYDNNVNVGEGHVYVNGAGNFSTGEYPIVKNFTITKETITNDNMSVPVSIKEGRYLTESDISINVMGRDLVRCESDGNTNCDYIVTISGNTGIAGDTINVVAEGRNNYEGTATANVSIVAKDVQTVSFNDVTGGVAKVAWDDAGFTHEATTTGDGVISYRSTDGNVATVDTNSGAVTIVGIGETTIIASAAETSDYAYAEGSYSLVVTKKAITIDGVNLASKTYNGLPFIDISSITLSENSLTLDTDYTAEAMSTGASAGTYDVMVSVLLNDDAFVHYCFAVDEDNCVNSGWYTVENVTISPLTLTSENTTAVLNETEFTYNGSVMTPAATVTVTIDGTQHILSQGDDYTITYQNNVNAGPATATITGIGNYTGTLEPLGFTINVAAAENVQVSAPSQIYTGTALEPVPTVTATVNGEERTLTLDVDYEILEHTDFVDAGSHRYVIASPYNSNIYVPITQDYFVINPYEISNSDIELSYSTVKYNGSEQKPNVIVRVGDVTVDSTEYNVSFSDDTIGNDTSDTIVTVTVTAKEEKNITGSATATYTITPREVLTISGINSQSVAYTGSPVVLAGNLTVSNNTDGITVSDLTTKWYESDGITEISQPTGVGSYVVVYSYDGVNYRGSLTVGFDIVKATSPEPTEMTANFRIEAGKSLSEISGTRTTGFNWNDGTTVVADGQGTYAATYTYNGDTTNYTTLNLAVPVYGLKKITILTATVNGGDATTPGGMALEGDSLTWTFIPDDGYELAHVALNLTNVTGDVVNNQLTVTAGTDDITLVALFRRVYQFIDGMGQTHIRYIDDVATFEIDADYELFKEGGNVYVDGELVDPSNYESWSNSTVIQFKKDYMDSLALGEHALAVNFSDGGIARTTFIIGEEKKETPQASNTGMFTGADGGAMVATGFVSVAVIVAAGVAYKMLRKSKEA